MTNLPSTPYSIEFYSRLLTTELVNGNFPLRALGLKLVRIENYN